MRSMVIAAAIVLVSSVASQAQVLRDQSPAQPKTKLEAFNGESGAVIIKGYTDIGTINSLGAVTIAAMTFKNAKTGDETKGLSILLKNAATYVSESNAYIDYDEIAGLLSGIDYISQADTSVTKFANFEATYSTRGNVKITVFNNSTGLNQVNMKVGLVGNGVFMKVEELTKLRENIAAAKGILDNPDSAVAKGNRAGTAMPLPAQTVSQPAPLPAPASAVAPKPKIKPSAPGTQPLKLNQ
jgi:hypothetical protein